MNVDQHSRDLLLQQSKHREMLSKIDEQKASIPILSQIVQFLSLIFKTMPSKDDISNINTHLEDLSIAAFPEKVEMTSEQLVKAVKEIQIPEIPKQVTIDNLDEVIAQFKPLIRAIESLKKVETINKVEVTNPTSFDTKQLEILVMDLSSQVHVLANRIQPPKEMPTSFDVNNEVAIKEWSELLDAMEELKKGFNLLLKKDFGAGAGEVMDVNITNYPPQMTPQPVTKIDINPLRGEFTSKGVTVGITVTPLPGTPLARRRSMIVFNNDTTKTLYLGGSNVTTSGLTIGLPVSPQGYSPPVDCAANMVLYGITTTGTLQAITLELSNDYGTVSTSPGNI